MNIPLDNLYHWIRGFAQHPVMLYVFQTHGSKDIFDLNKFDSTLTNELTPGIICHDQEPLDFDYHKFEYDTERIEKLVRKWQENTDPTRYSDYNFIEYIDSLIKYQKIFHTNLSQWSNYHASWLNVRTAPADWTILLHSECNSADVDQFAKTGFRPVYYWSHAVLARDWYRFAQHDMRLQQKSIEKTFLVYCRDWTPLREYRLKFLDLLLSAGLVNDCKISTQHINAQGVHLKDYQVQDSKFNFDRSALLTIPENHTPSHASADYDAADHCSTAVTVILETVFDNNKIHLTEKTLRPIACGHAFVLAAGPRALEYLRSYGFKTFGHIFDETYDTESDSIKRLEKIISTMKQIQNLTESQWQEVNSIVLHNQQHFFSQDFFNQVSDELDHNLNKAIEFCLEHRGQTWWQVRKYFRKQRMLSPFAKHETKKEAVRILRSMRSRNGTSPAVS